MIQLITTLRFVYGYLNIWNLLQIPLARLRTFIQPENLFNDSSHKFRQQIYDEDISSYSQLDNFDI